MVNIQYTQKLYHCMLITPSVLQFTPLPRLNRVVSLHDVYDILCDILHGYPRAPGLHHMTILIHQILPEIPCWLFGIL